MTVLISGGAKNGKSSLAQDLAVRMADGGNLYYIATMIPVDDEDRDRIRRHVEDRRGMGFQTIECGRGILSSLENTDKNGTFLVDSLTALLANEMFHSGSIDRMAGTRCAGEVVQFSNSVKNAVLVSDNIFCDAAEYDEVTELYRRSLATVDRAAAQACGTVIELSVGCQVVFKGGV